MNDFKNVYDKEPRGSAEAENTPYLAERRETYRSMSHNLLVATLLDRDATIRRNMGRIYSLESHNETLSGMLYLACGIGVFVAILTLWVTAKW